MTDKLIGEFEQSVSDLISLDNKTVHVALSGGLDSVVLLHLFNRLQVTKPNFKLKAHHIHHGLSVNGDSWAMFCASFCEQLKIDFQLTKVVLNKQSRTSLEALARDKRYEALKANFTSSDVLVTAHHQDDQLETVLLALKRGAGLTGLQGIRGKQGLEKGYLVRPLLYFVRGQLEDYAQQFDLTWVEDESNQDQIFDRNFIRHSLTPLLKQRWPSIGKTVARSASLCQDQQQLINEIAESDFETIKGDDLSTINLLKLERYSKVRQNNVLRYWFKKNRLAYPSVKQLQSIFRDVINASEHATPQFDFSTKVIRRYQSSLYLLEKQVVEIPESPLLWQGQTNLSFLSDDLILFLNEKKTAGHCVEIYFRAHLPCQCSCQPIGRDKPRQIKKLLQEYNVPPWQRDCIPFIFIDGQLKHAWRVWECA